MSRCAAPYQQRAEDLPERLCVQAVAGLRLGHLGQVGEEILQGEPVMQGYRGGVLNNQAHLSVLAFTQGALWKRHSDGSNLHRTYPNTAAGRTQSAEKVCEPVSVKDSSVSSVLCAEKTKLQHFWHISVTSFSPDSPHFPN